MAIESTLGTRAIRTRAAILAAAESLFSERGFSATRLEDVAERVGIRRASIVYYFKDKRELYDVVLESVFSGLLERIGEALSGPEPLLQRIEASIAAWVDYVGRRPSIARLILRETANATPERRSAVLRHTRPFFTLIEREVFQREDDLPTAEVDPVHLASTIAGATIFFFAAMPSLVPELEIDPTSAPQVDAHKEQVLRIVRRLLEAG
jgi:TetR/AcrR family transcriptional regulator